MPLFAQLSDAMTPGAAYAVIGAGLVGPLSAVGLNWHRRGERFDDNSAMWAAGYYAAVVACFVGTYVLTPILLMVMFFLLLAGIPFSLILLVWPAAD